MYDEWEVSLQQLREAGWEISDSRYPNTSIQTVEFPMWYTREQALELALEHVRGYEDRMFLQFLINVERRKNVS